MTSMLWAVYIALALQSATAQQSALPASFVGTWVGVQTWTSPGAPPSARTPQQVSLDIEMVDGKLVGRMPFFGGTDVATFVDARIVGDELEAAAVVQRAPAAEGAPARAPQAAWYDDVRIQFRFKADKVALTGTADVLMGDVKWMTFKYDLGKKRTRY